MAMLSTPKMKMFIRAAFTGIDRSPRMRFRVGFSVFLCAARSTQTFGGYCEI